MPAATSRAARTAVRRIRATIVTFTNPVAARCCATVTGRHRAPSARLTWLGGQPQSPLLGNAVGQINYPTSPSVVIPAKERSRRLLPTTKTLENAIAAPANIGLSRPRAASGIAATL
jgi:hypothetical protein